MPNKSRIAGAWAGGSSESYGPFASGVDVPGYTFDYYDFISHSNGFRRVNSLLSVQRSNISSGMTGFDTYTGAGLFLRGYRGELSHLPYSPGPSILDQTASLNGWGAIGLSRALSAHIGGTGDIATTGAELATTAAVLKSLKGAIQSHKDRGGTNPFPKGPLPQPGSGSRFSRFAKAVSSLYLGFQFGLKPSATSILNAISVYNGYTKALGHPPEWKRYRINLSSSRSVEDHYTGTRNVPVMASIEYKGGTKSREEEIWFTCHLRDKIALTPHKRQAINAGAIVDGQTLYQLAAWSWLADWIVPISDNLQNINLANYVHIRHCAVMNQVSYKANATSEVTFPVGDEEDSVTVSSSHDVVMKRRSAFINFAVSPVIPKLGLFRVSVLGALAATLS